MSHRPLHAFGLSLLVACIASAGAAPPADPAPDQAAETAKIEQLIKHVREMKETQFIRNCDVHDGAAAAKHIEAKWSKVKDQIKTAREFIEKCASKSERSGEPYKIRFKDGREQTASEYLNAQLDALEKAPK